MNITRHLLRSFNTSNCLCVCCLHSSNKCLGTPSVFNMRRLFWPSTCPHSTPHSTWLHSKKNMCCWAAVVCVRGDPREPRPSSFSTWLCIHYIRVVFFCGLNEFSKQQGALNIITCEQCDPPEHSLIDSII